MATADNAPNSGRFCSTCGAPAPPGEPCLPCALAQAFATGVEAVPAPEPSARAARFDPSALPCAFGRYQVRREVAIGGMGAVYEAFDTRLGRTVALKLMRSLLLATPEEKARFRAESGAVAKLDHANIVPIYEVGEQGGQPYFTMKLIEGRSLAERLKDGPLPPREAAALMAAVARAVQHAHERGVLHRDLKPGNILLDGQGQPWLTDFGLAKQTASDSDLTRTGASLGTPEYMSPEQAAGRLRDVSPASDVWALGVVFFQMLTGQVPFRGDNPAEVFRKIAQEEVENLLPGQRGQRRLKKRTSEGPSIPLDLATLVLRCLQKEPARRLSSAAFLADELERWLAGKPILSRPVTRGERALSWLRRHPWPVTAGAATGIALLALLLPLMQSRPVVPPEANPRLMTSKDALVGVMSPCFGPAGWLYATAAGGGKFGFGSVFRFQVDKPDQVELLTHFSGRAARPGGLAGGEGPLVAPGDGGIYGITTGGGSNDTGTIFRIGADGSAMTLHEFAGGAGGRRPSSVQLHSDGWLWGGLDGGGAADKGGVFRFDPGSRRYELVFSCSGPDDPVKSGRGCEVVSEPRPGYRLFVAGGGAPGTRRAIFSLSGSGPPQLRHVFPAQGDRGPDDFLSIPGFVEGADGGIYFPTRGGGNFDSGTLQRLGDDGSPPVIAHHFQVTDGATPMTPLLRLPDGRLCGAATGGGSHGQGVIFAFLPGAPGAPGELQALANLHHQHGELWLTPDPDGALYGCHKDDQSGSRFFRCDPDRPGALREITRFLPPAPPPVPGPPAQPGRLLADADGAFYGLCSAGGTTGHGTLFRWKEGSQPETIAEFTGAGGAVRGTFPFAQLAFGSDRALYGMTRAGGEGASGTIYRFDPATAKHTLLAFMEGLHAEGLHNSTCGMVPGPDSALYGTALLGGVVGCGSVFRVIPPRDGRRAKVETVAEFTGPGGRLPGNRPGVLVAGNDGALYGVPQNNGGLFRIDGNGVEPLGPPGPPRLDGSGPAPNCLLAPAPDGWLYGLPYLGKRYTMFRFHPGSGLVEMIPGKGAPGWGYTGRCGLVNDGRGGFLAVSANLGPAANGGILRLQPDGRFETVALFTGKGGALPGRRPMHELLPVGNDFFGTCSGGGSGDRGVIFKLGASGEAKTLAEF